MGKIPFFNLSEQTGTIRAEVDAAIAEVIDNTAFVLGPALDAFEMEIRHFAESMRLAGGTIQGIGNIQVFNAHGDEDYQEKLMLDYLYHA